MKILGEKSLSSKVEKGLRALFIIIMLLEICMIGITIIILANKDNGIIRIDNNLLEIALIIGSDIIILITGIVALYIIYQFIKIFSNLRENKLFDVQNTDRLNKVSISSFILGSLYFILLIGISITLKKLIDLGVLSNLLIVLLIFLLSIAFLIFGIGIKILNEIYQKAIEYKEENDFTI